MIALDASALVAIVFKEDPARTFRKSISEFDCILGAPTRLEAEMVVSRRLGRPALDALRLLLAAPTIEIVPFTPDHCDAAFDAFDRFGRGRHPAKLNFGDCMAYAVAKLANAPLLYKGDDFALTDIRAAIPQGPP